MAPAPLVELDCAFPLKRSGRKSWGAGVRRVILSPLPGTERGRQVRTTRGRGANRGPCRVTAPTVGPSSAGRRGTRAQGAWAVQCWRPRGREGCVSRVSRSVSRLEMGPSPIPSLPAGQTVSKEREEMTWANENVWSHILDSSEPPRGTEGGSSGVRVRALLCRDRVRLV